MRFDYLSGLALAAIVTIGACAQQEEPAPIAPEVVYDKYGNAAAACRPADQPVGATYSANLPICQPTGCAPGQQPAAGTTAARLVCVPIPERPDGDQPGGRQGGQSPVRG